MNMTRRFLLVSAALALLGLGALAQTPGPRVVMQKTADSATTAGAQKINYSGTVTDTAGHPLAGATVEYWCFEVNPFMASRLELKKQMTTEANGGYQFQVSQGSGVLLARKPGLAPAWHQFRRQDASGAGTEEKLVLTPPAALAGIVVDEAGKPVANAEVFVGMAGSEISLESGARTFNYATGKLARDCFSTRTDAAGHFRIENFPTNATAALAVRSPGKVLRESSQDSIGFDSLPWQGGQEDIKLVVEPAGSVEGKIIVEGSHQPPPVARVTLQGEQPGFFADRQREPVQSGADGAFEFRDVAAGSYHVHAVFGANAVPEWVADTAQVSVESGQPTRGVQITAMRGGLLEAAALRENDHKPLAKVMVNAYKEGYQSAASSDSNGVALLRLPPGDYQVMASLESMRSRGQTTASVEAGKTNRVEIEIPAPQEITGIVRQPDGRPAAGLEVRLVGVYGPEAANVKTDDQAQILA